MTTLSIPVLSQRAADALIDIATKIAKEKELSLCFAVTDPAGHLISFRRMDDAGLISVDVAIGKARTASLFGKDTDGFATMIDEGMTSMLSVPGATMIAGGTAIILEGKCVGALGVSGATGDTDNQISSSAVKSFEGTIK